MKIINKNEHGNVYEFNYGDDRYIASKLGPRSDSGWYLEWFNCTDCQWVEVGGFISLGLIKSTLKEKHGSAA